MSSPDAMAAVTTQGREFRAGSGSTGLPPFPERFQLTPEFELLIACSWVAPPSLERFQAARVVSLCDPRIQWEVFLSLVLRHGLTGLAYHLLQRYANDKIPSGVSDTLRDRQLQLCARALRQGAEMKRLHALFAGHGIDIVFLKGVLLSVQLYADPARRSSSDIDLMVRPEDVDQIGLILESAGYRCTFPGTPLTARQGAYLRTAIHHYKYVHTESGIPLELHWRSSLWTPEQAAGLWQRLDTIEWMGGRYRVLDQDLLLLQLCDHGAGHKWFSLKWLSDVAVLLARRTDSGRWDELLATADRLGLKRILAQSSLLVHWLYAVPLPSPLRQLILDVAATSSLCTVAVEAMLMGELAPVHRGRRLESFRYARYLVQLKPTMPYGLIMRRIMLSTVDLRRFPLPQSLFWMYIPLRPFFWFWRNFVKQMC